MLNAAELLEGCYVVLAENLAEFTLGQLFKATFLVITHFNAF